MNIRQMNAAKAARTFLVAGALLGSLPATADEHKGAGHPVLYASEEPVICDWKVTDSDSEQQTRWECWEPATGYVRIAISSKRIENREHNMLQSVFRHLRSVLMVAFSKQELPSTEPVTMLDVAVDRPRTPPTSR